MEDIIMQDPPQPEGGKPRIQWAPIILRISEEAPGVWVIAARDVNPSIATHLQRAFGVETRTHGRDPNTGRVAELYVRFTPGRSFLNERAIRIRDQRNRAAAARAKIAAKRQENEK